MSDPYGQPSPYGQQQYGQSPYGQPVDDRRPGTVTAAAWITIVFSAIVAAVFGFTTFGFLVARDQVITEIEKVPEFQDANIDADTAVGVLVAVLLGFVLWSVIAIVLAVFVLRRSNVARILLIISATVSGLLSLLSIQSGITILTLIASIATIVLLVVGGASAWFKGPGGGTYGGYPQPYPGQQPYGATDPYGSSYGQPTSSPQYPSASDRPSDNPYGQPDPYGQQPPRPSENPYGQPPADGQDGSDHPPREYPGR